jgi:hypothetical protein
MGWCLRPRAGRHERKLGQPCHPRTCRAAAARRTHGQAAARARSTPATSLADPPAACDAAGQQPH